VMSLKKKLQNGNILKISYGK